MGLGNFLFKGTVTVLVLTTVIGGANVLMTGTNMYKNQQKRKVVYLSASYLICFFNLQKEFEARKLEAQQNEQFQKPTSSEKH
jgi:hypothetical protein